jgi:hypothetical protein
VLLGPGTTTFRPSATRVATIVAEATSASDGPVQIVDVQICPDDPTIFMRNMSDGTPLDLGRWQLQAGTTAVRLGEDFRELESHQTLAVFTGSALRMFSLAQAEQELRQDLDDNLFSSWEGKPAVIADRVSVVVGPLLPRQTAPTWSIGATFDSVTDNPSSYVGQNVTVCGEVDDVDLLPRAFSLEDRDLVFDEHLLVGQPTRFPRRPGERMDRSSTAMLLASTRHAPGPAPWRRRRRSAMRS